MATALVTGGAGFIGHHLVGRLLAAGWSVVAFDDLSTGVLTNLRAVQDHSRFRFVRGDVLQASQLQRVCAETTPDTVFHLAALHFVPACDENPARTLELNVLGTQRVIDATAATATRFILASTGDVYAPSLLPHTEDDPRGSLGIYGVSKAAAEDSVRIAAKRRPATRYLVARFFNTYGPGETNPHVIPDVLRAVRAGGTLRLGNLTAVRDYIHTDDLVEGLLHLSVYDGTHHVVNLGSGQGRTVADIVAAMGMALGRQLDVQSVTEKLRPIERQSLRADIRRAASELAWRPRVDFTEGIGRLLRVEGLA